MIQQLTGEMTREERRNVRVNDRHYTVIGHMLFKIRIDGILQRCVSEIEAPSILAACHDSAYGGHFLGLVTGEKVFMTCYFWPDLFKMLRNMLRNAMFVRGMRRMTSVWRCHSICLYL